VTEALCADLLTRDVAAADHLVQDCSARALEKIGLWEQGTDLRAWMFTILYHLQISHPPELHKSDTRVTLSPDHTIGLEVRDLKHAIAKLPKEQQSVILLVGLKGMASPKR
jgi:RNA polymerase sigma-70 factor (ECF subfamily)